MNERIKELAKQVYGTQSTEQEIKFAELIVKECVGIVDKIVPPGYEDYPDYSDQIENAFRRECAIEIKKHFGVEE